MSKLEKLMGLNNISDVHKPDPISELNARLDAIIEYQGLSVRKVSGRMYEVVKDSASAGDYTNPILWKNGDMAEVGKWYYTETEGVDMPHECIQSGCPLTFYDRMYFDYI